MKLNGKIKKYGLISSFSGGIIVVLVSIIALNFFNPLGLLPSIDFNDDPLIMGSAARHSIEGNVQTNFATYSPTALSYQPQVTPTSIQSNLANVNLQGLEIPAKIIPYLEEYGFALVDEGYDDIYKIYDDGNFPQFITTDLCLHAYHVMYDISLRILEGTHFSDDFETMLMTLRTEQMTLNSSVTESNVHDALNKNIAYLSVMLYLIDNSTVIPTEVEDLVNSELNNINTGVPNYSAIFGYEEDFTQYKVRGHYTRNEILSNYFKAMMYAGRMSFLLQSPSGEIEMGIEHTRMALLLTSSFNATVGSDTVWDFWDRVYQPTVFYVGASDDLTPIEYYSLLDKFNFPEGDQLADETLIRNIMDEAKTYRKPQINSMFIYDTFESENVTQGFRLMGQRFIPDSYIFQQLVHSKVNNRMFPNGLDVFSVFGSSRAEYHLQSENASYEKYSSQILKLRSEFSNLTDTDWTQNLYWLWLYSLFPLLSSPTDGYPGFMLSDAWIDKALMTTMGSWAELRHDTILYAKQSYSELTSVPKIQNGFVEPYPELYARLGSLVRLMKNGLDARDLNIEGFDYKFDSLSTIFDRLVDISIKELENKPLNESDISFIAHVAEEIEGVASFQDPEADPWVSEADDRMAIIADVHTDPNSAQVLEVGTGNPYTIYVIVQDADGNLRLTKGGTFSYYEFKHPMSNRLSDEEWHEMLDTNPPVVPEWISDSLHIHVSTTILIASSKED